MKRRVRYKVSSMGPRSVDTYVGKRLRTARTLSGISQENLGEAVGLSFQQIQKYENGMNRVSASRLYEFSSILDVTVEWFFEGCDQNDPEVSPPNFNKRETLELVRNFDACSDEYKKSVLNFVKVAADESGKK